MNKKGVCHARWVGLQLRPLKPVLPPHSSLPRRARRYKKRNLQQRSLALREEFFFGSLARHWAQESPVIPPPTQTDTEHTALIGGYCNSQPTDSLAILETDTSSLVPSCTNLLHTNHRGSGSCGVLKEYLLAPSVAELHMGLVLCVCARRARQTRRPRLRSAPALRRSLPRLGLRRPLWAGADHRRPVPVPVRSPAWRGRRPPTRRAAFAAAPRGPRQRRREAVQESGEVRLLLLRRDRPLA